MVLPRSAERRIWSPLPHPPCYWPVEGPLERTDAPLQGRHTMTPEIRFGTPRKLPNPKRLNGRVVVLDVAFAGVDQSQGFHNTTLKFIDGLGERLRGWIDHHDHIEHARFAKDPRFVLATKAEHGACPEMIDSSLVHRIGPVDTIVCHTDFDGLASAAKWILGGEQPYAACDADARAIDTRLGRPGPEATMMDRALRANPRDAGLQGAIVQYLVSRLTHSSLRERIETAAAALEPIERETRRAAQSYRRLDAGLAFVDVTNGFGRIDMTYLLLLGQERERVAVVLDRNNAHVAARFDSGLNFLELLGLPGGMPTRVALPRKRAAELLGRLGVSPGEVYALLA